MGMLENLAGGVGALFTFNFESKTGPLERTNKVLDKMVTKTDHLGRKTEWATYKFKRAPNAVKKYSRSLKRLDLGLFSVIRKMNTLAAGVRFLQLTILTFILGNVAKGFYNTFLKTNVEIEQAALSMEAIISAQEAHNLKQKLALKTSEQLTKEGQAYLDKISRAKSEWLAMETTKFATSLGQDPGEMMSSARGIQVQTKNVKDTMKLLKIASRLTLLEPGKGIGFATVPIKELLQGQGIGDFRSLARRFEITFSKEFKQKFVKSVKSGKVSEAIKLFERELENIGLGEKIIKKMRESTDLSFAFLRGQLRMFFSKIGGPLFERVKDVFTGLATTLFKYDFLNSLEAIMLTNKFGDFIYGGFSKPIIDFVENGLKSVWQFIRDPINVDKIINNLTRFMNVVGNIFSGIGDLFLNILQGLTLNKSTSIMEQLTIIGDNINKFIESIIQNTGPHFSNNLKDIGMNIGFMFRQLMSPNVGKRLGEVTALLSTLLMIISYFGSAVTFMFNLATMFGEVIRFAGSHILSTITTLTFKIHEIFISVLSSIVDNIPWAKDTKEAKELRIYSKNISGFSDRLSESGGRAENMTQSDLKMMQDNPAFAAGLMFHRWGAQSSIGYSQGYDNLVSSIKVTESPQTRTNEEIIKINKENKKIMEQINKQSEKQNSLTEDTNKKLDRNRFVEQKKTQTELDFITSLM